MRNHPDILPQRMFVSFLYVVLLVATGCQRLALHSLAHGAQGKTLTEAVKYLSAWREAGKLPGVATGEHGELNGYVVSPSSPVFPRKVRIELVREGDTTVTYRYVVAQDEQNTTWYLVEAKRIDNQTKQETDLLSPGSTPLNTHNE